MSLKDDLSALAILDRRVMQCVIEKETESLISILTEYQTLRKSVRTRLLDQPVFSVDEPEAVILLRKITTGDGLPTDKLLNQLFSMLGSEQLPEEFSDNDIDALGSDLFYSWFSHYEYVNGLAELRPLVVCSSVGESVYRIVRQVKDCYAFQQYEATYSLCRTVIEASIRDICVRCHLFPKLGEREVLTDHISFHKLREKVASDLLQDELKLIYGELSTVLHARKSVSKVEARRAFENTLQVIEALYMEHGL